MWIVLGQTSKSVPSGWSELVAFQLTGLAIVITVLAILWIGIAVIGGIFKALNWKDPEPATATVPASQTRALTPEIKAAIAAALHVVIKDPHRIVSVQPTSDKR